MRKCVPALSVYDMKSVQEESCSCKQEDSAWHWDFLQCYLEERQRTWLTLFLGHGVFECSARWCWICDHSMQCAFLLGSVWSLPQCSPQIKNADFDSIATLVMSSCEKSHQTVEVRFKSWGCEKNLRSVFPSFVTMT